MRLKQASSTLADLARRLVPAGDRRSERQSTRTSTRLVFCSGKVYYDIAGHEARAQATQVAVARLEQLYPFPVDAYAALIARYPNLREVVWAQEEPQNMGAWRTIRHRLEAPLKEAGVPLTLRRQTLAGRARARAIPTAHLREQDRIVRAALGTS